MRRSEITPELIELSKRAKELGFPQDIEQGDWIFCECKDIPDQPRGYGLECIWDEHPDIGSEDLIKSDTDCLILSFSRCLEWLVKRSWILRLPYQKDLMKKDIEFSEWFDGEFTKQEVFIKGYLLMENPDLWVAKAVVKILEGKE